MEAMEVDPLRHSAAVPATPTGTPAVAPAAAPLIISESGSSTEVDEDDDTGGGGEGGGARVVVPLTLPATWAFSQRRAGRGGSATQSPPVRRRVR